jgi:hypothetical protein
MVSTPSFPHEPSKACLTYSGSPRIVPEGMAPNFVARKMSFLFPVRLNLAEINRIGSLLNEINAPLSKKFLRIPVYIYSVPMGTALLISRV